MYVCVCGGALMLRLGDRKAVKDFIPVISKSCLSRVHTDVGKVWKVMEVWKSHGKCHF